MKKLFLIGAILFAVNSFAQFSLDSRTGFTQIKSYSTTLILTGNQTKTLYVPFPLEKLTNWEALIDTTLPAYNSTSYTNNWHSTGDVFLDVLPVTTSGITDSLNVYMLPLSLHSGLEAYHVVTNDTTFLDFVTPDIAEHPRYLDWTTATSYGIPLSGETWSTCGLVFKFQQVDEADAAVNTLYITIWFVW